VEIVVSNLGTARPAATDADEIDLGRVIGVLWAGKLWIVFISVLFLAGGLLFVLATPPTYQADALLQLEERNASLALPASLQGMIDDNPRTITEIEIIRSRMILGRVVAELRLDVVASPRLAPIFGYALTRFDLPLPDYAVLRPYARKGSAILVEMLQVPPAFVAKPLALVLTGDEGYRVTLPDGAELSGVVGETLRDDARGFALRLGQLSGRIGQKFDLVQLSEAVAISGLREALSVSERGRQSGILEVRLKSSDPSFAQRSLDAVLNAYVRQNISRGSAEAENSLAFIENQLPEAQRTLAEAEAILNDYRRTQQSVDLSFETQDLLTQISRIEAQLLALKSQEDELSQRYTANHPSYVSLLSQRSRLQEQLSTLREEVDRLPETQRDVLNLTRNVELAQQLYTQLLTRAQEVQVLRASNIGNVRIIDSAQAAIRPIAPRSSLILALSLVLGGMFGIGFVLLRNWLRKGVQGAPEIEDLGLPVFATINYANEADMKRARRRSEKPPIITLSDPNGIVAEGFRSLRTSLHFGLLDSASKSIAILSPAPEAGKSFCAVNLASVAAQAGQSVCLIDADLRRGTLRKYFGLRKNAAGLAEVLADSARLEDVLAQTHVPGLSVIASGRFPPNPSELLLRKTFAALLQELDQRFDLIIIDNAPALAVTDPVIVAQAAGASLLIVRHDNTPLGEVIATQRAFETSGVKLTGAVINGFDPRKSAASSGYSYSYNYRYSYKQKPD
jgi:tyrosine-protein kinase Etk/Wzc